jgi:alpha-mannosidase
LIAISPFSIVNGILGVDSQITGHLLSVLDFRVATSSSGPRELIAAQPDDLIDAAGLGPAQGGNRFLCGQDAPFFWDAWDTMPYALEALHTQGRSRVGSPADWAVSVVLLESGPLRARLRVTLPHVGDSEDSWLQQDVLFELGSARIDFLTTVKWDEKHKILKVRQSTAVVLSIRSTRHPRRSAGRVSLDDRCSDGDV